MSDWRVRAACLDAVDADFFPERSSGSQYEAAREVCGGCDVRAVCLAEAMAAEGSRSHDSRFGMLGGLTPTERQARYRATHTARKAANLTPTAARAAIAKAAAVEAVAIKAEQTTATVATLTTQGRSAAEISLRLGISPRQVVRYRAAAAGRTAAPRKAAR